MAAVRAMTVADLDAVMRLELATPEAPHWPRVVYEGFLSKDGPLKQIFVAECGSRLTGFAAAGVAVDSCELESIVVEAAARRIGIGKALLATVIDWASRGHALRIQLEVRSGNDSAVAFYWNAGFKRDGLRRAYYPDSEEDALLMSLALDSRPEDERCGGKLSRKSD